MKTGALRETARILLVEDNSFHSTLIQRSFAADDDTWKVDHVDRVSDAADYLATYSPDLLIVDVALPDGSGVDLLAHQGEHLTYPVVVLTGQGDEKVAVQAMKAGASDYVTKSEATLTEIPAIASRVLKEWALVQARRAAQDALRISRDRYQKLVDDMPFSICRFSPEGEITFASDRFAGFHGMSVNDLVGMNFFELLPEAVRAEMRGGLGLLTSQQPVTAYEYEVLSATGKSRWYRLINRALFQQRGSVAEYQSAGEDITERKNEEKELQKRATVDFLTGLPNRSQFEEQLGTAMSRAKRFNHKLALLYMDLDGFKSVNDTMGHPTGDMVLKAVAERLRESVRDMDTVARLGGDEFSVMLEQPSSVHSIVQVIDRIIAALCTPYEVYGKRVSLSVSIGVGIYPNDADDVEKLIEQADRAMYLAKQNETSQYEFPSAADVD